MSWHCKTVGEVLDELASSADGLSAAEAARRLATFGPNELEVKRGRSPLSIFLDQFRDFMILVLIAAAIISGSIGEASDTVAIVVIVVLNAIIGFVQEYRAERAMAALKGMAAPAARVMRGATPGTVAAARLVPGDIVLLEAGSIVPADLRLTEAVQLRIEEAPLTGESLPVEKRTVALRDAHLPIGDRTNMAYKGTLVTYGRGTGVVVQTGMATELGRIASLLQEEKGVRTPLQKRLASFGKRLALAVIAICAIVFVIGITRGEEPLLMLLTAISLAVAAIPEALPAVVTISLALGAGKMVRQNALIRKLPAVETLGSVTYICTDKTGTLTQNRMTVEEVWLDGTVLGREELQGLVSGGKAPDGAGILLTALALSNDARQDREGGSIGDPTEVALLEIARGAGFEKGKLEQEFARVAEIPFDSERKCMTTFHAWSDGKLVSFTKGAIEALSERSGPGAPSAGAGAAGREALLAAAERMAADGMRVLGIAMRSWDSLPDSLTPEIVERELTILGLVGMMDPPRGEAQEAVSHCGSAGIRVVMITGDHPLTARAIARRIGIVADDAGGVLSGRELDRLPASEFEKRVADIRVYARVAPEQKLKIVRALQERGEFVAMTGDGVNDAPALKRADIGIAMGVTGTDVAKEAADMVLLDDNFATIVRSVRQGRRIFDNIRKFVKYTMTSNSGEIWTIFLAPFLGLPIPLLPIHILWINLVTDGLPGLALAAEPAERGIMNRPPRHPRESIFARGLGIHIVWVGLLMGFVSIFTQAWAIRGGDPHWQTMVFTVLCLSQMGHVLAIRSERDSLFSQGLFSNRPLLGAFLLTFALQMATVYLPVLNPIFKTRPLPLPELLFTLALSSVVFVAVEMEKLFRRRRGAEGEEGG
ncbi:MAG: cation-translocating P-type ATPase [Geobacteraceae bacterium]|nr:cation-translocating P-type ATPase [Geobacteraceae bacterium]